MQVSCRMQNPETGGGKETIHRLHRFHRFKTRRRGECKWLLSERDPRTHAIWGSNGSSPGAWVRVPGARLPGGLAVEFELRGIPFQREVVFPIHYKGRLIKSNYRADFVALSPSLWNSRPSPPCLELRSRRSFTTSKPQDIRSVCF